MSKSIPMLIPGLLLTAAAGLFVVGCDQPELQPDKALVPITATSVTNAQATPGYNWLWQADSMSRLRAPTPARL